MKDALMDALRAAMIPARVLVYAMILTLTIGVACQGPLIGTNGQPTTEQALGNEAVTLVDSWQTQIASLEANAAIRPLTPAEQWSLAQLKGNIQVVSNLLADAVGPGGEIDVGAAVSGGAMLLPPPWNILISVLGGGAAEWWRNRKTRNSFKRLVEAINRIKKKDPAFAESLDNNSATLRMEMGETATRVVDNLRNGGHLPII